MSDRHVDVYESDNLPESDQNAKFQRDETNDPEHIELVHIDIEAAKRRFQGRLLNCDDVDFSDSIAHRRRKAYGSCAYVLEVVGKDYNEPETPEQKLNRLTYEIAELADTIKGSETSADGLLTLENLNQMLEEVKGMQVNKKSGQTLTTSSDVSKNAASEASGSTDAHVIALEKRLRNLENLMGPLSSSSQSVVDAVEDLKFRTEALNPNYVEGLESRLNTLLTKLDQVEEKRGGGGGNELESKVDELHQLMSKWDGVCTALPSQLKKLHALSRLHEHAQHFSERISRLAGVRDQMEKALAADRMSMAELQNKAKEDIGALLQKVSDLDARLKKAGH